MEVNYFITPVSSLQSFDNYKKTIENGIEVKSLSNIPAKIASHGDKIRLWGLSTDKMSRWEKIKKGDKLFFYRNKNVISYTEILDKFIDPYLAEDLWGHFVQPHYPEFTWPLIVITNKPTEINLPFSVINNIVGYDSNYCLRSFFLLNDKFVKHLKQVSFAEFIYKYEMKK